MKRIPGWLSLLATVFAVGAAFALVAFLNREGRPRVSAPAEPEAMPSDPVLREAPVPVRAATVPERRAVEPSASVDDFLTEYADRSTRFASGRLGNRLIHAGFYANGLVRLVDSSGRCYQGTAENAVARMREQAGSATFDLRISGDGRTGTRGSFHGGPYDGLTIAFEA